MRSYQPRLSAAVRNALIISPVHISVKTPAGRTPAGIKLPAISVITLPITAPIAGLPPNTVATVAPAALLNTTAQIRLINAIKILFISRLIIV